MQIMTVRGPISPEEAGFVLPHEHLLCDLWPFTGSYDAILDDENIIIPELIHYQKAGGKTIVEVSSIGLGRDPKGLRRISENTGLNVVMGSGWYREKVYPSYVYELSTNELAEKIFQDITIGADDSGIRAGVIGEIGTERYHITPAQERVFRAAARAQRTNTACIATATAKAPHRTNKPRTADSRLSWVCGAMLFRPDPHLEAERPGDERQPCSEQHDEEHGDARGLPIAGGDLIQGQQGQSPGFGCR